MMVLLDTNIVSYIFKGHRLAERYLPNLQGQELAISAMTVAELLEWSIVHEWGANKLKELQLTITGYTILPLDEPIWLYWAKIRAMCRVKGLTIGVADAWIAATALHYNIPLITHNAKDFIGVDNLVIISYE